MSNNTWETHHHHYQVSVGGVLVGMALGCIPGVCIGFIFGFAWGWL